MEFNVSGLLKDGIGETRQYDVAGELPAEEGAPEPVEGHVHLLRALDGILVTADLRVTVSITCSRCLNTVDVTLPVEFEEEFLQTHDVRSGTPVAAGERDPEAFVIDENHTLDLTEAVRQYREVAREIKPLCRPDCRGLCPNCGKDLNAGPCDCETGIIDTRWAGLAALRAATADGKDT